MSGSDGPEGAPNSPAARMGFAAGQVVLEIGLDEDAEASLRTDIEPPRTDHAADAVFCRRPWM